MNTAVRHLPRSVLTWITRQRKGSLVSTSCTRLRPSTVATTRRPLEKPSTVNTHDSVTPERQTEREEDCELGR